MAEDIRWQQRFNNDREQQGLIKVLECTFELTLNTLREVGVDLPWFQQLRSTLEQRLLSLSIFMARFTTTTPPITMCCWRGSHHQVVADNIDWDTTKPDGTQKRQLDVSSLAELAWPDRIPVAEDLVSTLAAFREQLNEHWACL